MKIIFLDIDGVIAPDYTKTNDQAFSRLNEWEAEPFSKRAVDLLNKILMSTNAKIVISSDWRLNYSLKDMIDIFCEAGILKGENIILGYTPMIKDSNYIRNRGNEILEWVALHKPKRWIAIDDLDLSSYLPKENFVHCKNTNEGIKQLGIREEILIKLGK